MFVAKIEALGLTFPTKLNPKGQVIHATGKSDPEFIQFKEANPQLNHVWNARSEVKSSLLESRIQTFQRVGNTAPNGAQSIPVPLVYAGAHTYRWSGTQYNMMNLPNLRTSKLRSCIRAPKDHVIVVSDLSQVELRVNMWLCGQMDVHDLLANGKDLYKHYASQSLNKPEDQVTKTERQLAKVKILGLGYQMGPDKFRHTLATGALGSDPVIITEDEARRAVAEYRQIHHKVVDTWKELTNVLNTILHAEPTDPITTWRGLKLSKECIELPDGMKLRYPHLQATEDGNLQYGFDPKIHKIYSGLLAENIVQALSRSIIAKQIIDIEDAGYKTVMMVHDEVLVVCHKDQADKALADVIKIMSTTPDWAEGLVLSAEGAFDTTYSK
jgi:DNA polymerase